MSSYMTAFGECRVEQAMPADDAKKDTYECEFVDILFYQLHPMFVNSY